MTTGDELRDHIAPAPDGSSGFGLVASRPDGDEAEAEVGPSDYVRRRWVAGMSGRADGMRGRRARAGDSEEDGWGNRIRKLGLGSRSSLCYPENSGSSSGTKTVAARESSLSSHSPQHRTRRTPRKHPSLPLSSLVPALLLPFLPNTSAAPSHTRPTSPSRSPPAVPRPTLPPRPTQSPARRDVVQFITSAAPPSTLPMESQLVAETLLPFILSQGSDGYWTKVDEGWRLYGRQSGESPVFAPDNPESTAASTWAIEDALPPGWGVQSTRTDFYRVPLIVVSSCIIAVGIVVTLIVIAFKRRKSHRRAKRRAERQRRKALAAAGLTEEGVNDSRNQENLREKLDDLQRQHRAKRKGDTAVVSSPSARSKVRNWRAGLRLRRRKGGKGDDHDQDQGGAGAVIVQKDGDRVGQTGEGERTSADTDRSTPTVPSVEPNTSDGIGSGLNTSSSDDPTSSYLNLATDSSRPMDVASQPGPTAPTAGSTTYFPPAYRPASVRSFAAGPSSPSVATSSSSAHPADPPSAVPTGAEKVRAPGYYPAPATAEGEVALAVASRSERKGRMPIPPPEVDDNTDQSNRDHTGHVATDDKRVLERLRMAASAPPQDMGEASDDGPSAPRVEVDESGFERIDLGLGGPSAFDLGSPIDHSTSSQPTTQTPTHPSLPAPPPSRPIFLRSYSVEREVHEQLDELNLLPSAPPGIQASGPSPADAPSAPPENVDGAAMPSAPPLLPDGDDDEEGDQEETKVAATAPQLPEPTEDHTDHTAEMRREDPRTGRRSRLNQPRTAPVRRYRKWTGVMYHDDLVRRLANHGYSYRKYEP